MLGLSLMTLLVWLILAAGFLLAVGVSANAIWRAIVPPMGMVRGASCGGCGYELGTFGEGRCPECGADLMKAGVLTRRHAVRLAGSLPAALMGWTFIVICVSSVLLGIATYVLFAISMGNMGGGGVQQVRGSGTLTPDPWLDDDTGQRLVGQDYSIATSHEASFVWGMGVDTGSMTLEIDGADVETPVTVEIDLGTGDFTVEDEDGELLLEGARFDPEEAIAAYEAAGLDLEPRGVKSQANQLSEYVLATMSDPSNPEMVFWNPTPVLDDEGNTIATSGGLTHTGAGSTFVGMGGVGTSQEEMWAMGVMGGVLVLAVLIWIGGVVFIVARRRRMLAPAGVGAGHGGA